MIHLHVDVDNLWVYEQEFGIKINTDKEYIYTHSLPFLLKLLQKTRSKATFMLIGRDLELFACQKFCRKAISLGHEIANHTWSHPISFGKLPYKEKKQQIAKTHKKIISICGRRPVGFRGAGYYQDKEIVSILHELNYEYDSSVLPGFAQLLMSAYASIKGGKNRDKTFGRPGYIASRQRPYLIQGMNRDQSIRELPISILPRLGLPIHTTFAYFFGKGYQDLILRHLKSKPLYVIYLLHAIDFVDLGEKYKNHPVIPLRYTFAERMNFIKKVLDTLVKINRGPLQTSESTVNNYVFNNYKKD